MRLHRGPTAVCSVTGDKLWPSVPLDNLTPSVEDALPTSMISVSAAAEGTRASAAVVASSALSRAAGVSAILAVGVDCWTAELLFCDSVLLCCFPVVFGFGVCCALGFQGAISLLFSYFCFVDRFTNCSLTGIYTPTGVCVRVFFPFVLDIKFVGRTSLGHTRGRSHRIFHPPSFCGACLNFSLKNNSAIPLPRREIGFCVLTI